MRQNRSEVALTAIPFSNYEVVLTCYSSTIIEHMISYTSSKPRSAVAYFYFDFNDAKKQRLQNCLSCLIAQLCQSMSTIPEKLKSLHNRCSGANQTPSLNDLTEVMSSFVTVNEFDNILLILDALDECPKDGDENFRSELLEWIMEISGQLSSSLRLLVTSRPEPDIGDMLCPAFQSLSIQGSQVKSDIGRYIQSQLSKDSKLRSLLSDVKAEIEKILADGADGM